MNINKTLQLDYQNISNEKYEVIKNFLDILPLEIDWLRSMYDEKAQSNKLIIAPYHNESALCCFTPEEKRIRINGAENLSKKKYFIQFGREELEKGVFADELFIGSFNRPNTGLVFRMGPLVKLVDSGI